MKIDTKPMPSLSMDGWITSTSIKADYLISHFFVSEYSRTFLFEGEVASMPYLIQKHKNDILGLVRDVELTTKAYCGRYFPKAEVQVSSKEHEAGKYSLIIVVIVTDIEGKEFSVGRLVDVLDSKINKIAQLNNTGETI